MALGYKVPTPVQRKALPVALAGADLVVMARTGSGKTAAFLIPVIEKLGAHSAKIGVRSIILSPTRELAVQVSNRILEDEATQISHGSVEGALHGGVISEAGN